ncbi:patatin-like phospholipase family protein [Mannheimia bovis]|uniref:patatin-like phospholipase family protein n=1 Tax=Mannheimia bovis TaxID=2770636 RepID=UPI0024B70D2D|nr:patatin-like phospholipase family protein [Mannheimia bovis]WHP47330.1 patatin-like phospholipase family protein [Mannheimia bovis]
MSVLKKIKFVSTLGVVIMLSACSLVTYKPVDTIKQVSLDSGYRQKSVFKEGAKDGNIIVVMFSGGGTRAAALGYGVLEELQKVKVKGTEKGNTLLDNIDITFGVSGGSVLATYFALEGKAIIPKFANNFLKSNFQKDILTEVFSLSNLPRLSSPQFGRGDLLQERFNLALYKGKKFGDLVRNRKGPFAVISATDMNIGQRLTFTQETFDGLCLNLNDLEIARAVAASSSVPLIFAPLTLNNNGGNCHFSLPKAFTEQEKVVDGLTTKQIEETEHTLSFYQDSKERPFIHLVDGGLTDNLGLASILDISDLVGIEDMYKRAGELGVKNVIVINVNAQNEVSSEIDKSPNVPGLKDVVNTIVNVPIDSTTQINLQRYSQFSDSWNKYANEQQTKIEMFFVNLGLKELPDGQLKKEVLNIPTSFYLPEKDIDKLRESARILLEQSEVYKKAVMALQ